MKETLDLQSLEKESWQLKEKFFNIIEPFRSDLWRYCRTLTGSPWDAEDLVQETMMKALASLGQIWQPLMPKTYLFRIATNTWINQCRRKRFALSPYDEDVVVNGKESAPFEVHEAMEILVSFLPPRQVAVVLLVDVFDFTARETAEMITTTEGAVKATLHRARSKLKSLSAEGALKMEMGAKSRKFNDEQQHIPNSHLINAFIDAFHRRDPDAIAALLDEHVYHDIVHVGQEYGKETVRTYSLRDDMENPKFHVHSAYYYTLWERPVVVILVNAESGPQLNRIIYLQTEDDKILFWKTYYFCKELLQEAAKELGVPVQTTKKYVGE
jgi:RNA polymerase sigma factor (sigma-70 family)